MDLISVIIPVFNVEEYLGRCVESVAIQTYKNIEIILVDDGSTDACPQICETYAKKDDRIRVIHKKNEGLSSARNVGLDISQGKYIFFVDSDDFIAPHMFEILMNRIKYYNADVAICEFIRVDTKGQIVGKSIISHKEEVWSGRELLAKNILEKKNQYVVAWNKLYKRDIFKELRFPVGKIHEDEFVFHKICDKCDLVVITGEELYFYTQRKDSIMLSGNYEKRIDVLDAYVDRSLYMRQIKNLEMEKAYYETLRELHDLLLTYCQLLGYDHPKVNEKIKKMRRSLMYFLPVLCRYVAKGLKSSLGIVLLFFSPKTYGKVKKIL